MELTRFRWQDLRTPLAWTVTALILLGHVALAATREYWFTAAAFAALTLVIAWQSFKKFRDLQMRYEYRNYSVE